VVVGGKKIPLPKIRRNGPCPCGSGSKTKRCCFAIQETGAVHRIPPELCKEVVLDLRSIDKVDLHSLFYQLVNLPEMDTALQTRFDILTPDMDRALDAVQNDNDREFDLALKKVVLEVDSTDRRIDLAGAVIMLRDQGRIPPKLAALAVFDLDRKESILFLFSVAKSLAVLAWLVMSPIGERSKRLRSVKSR
jgi:hypothetical protein